MSNKTNYNNFSKGEKKNWQKPVVQTVQANNTDDKQIVTEQQADNKSPNDAVKQIIKNPFLYEAVKGKVDKCVRLNIRKEPSVTADVVSIIKKDDIVYIDKSFENDDFYRIRYGAIKGYCMKDYIEIID